MNIGNYQRQLSEWMNYKRYSQESIKNYVSCIGKFLAYFENEATKPSEISADKIKRFLTRFDQPNTHKAYLSAIKLFYDKIGNQPNKLDKVEYPKQSKKLPIVLSQDEIQRMFNVSNKAGIHKRVYTHLIRHCTFTHMVENGTDINLIQKIAGHNNVKTTMIYCHLSDSLISKINSPINNIKLCQ